MVQRQHGQYACRSRKTDNVWGDGVLTLHMLTTGHGCDKVYFEQLCNNPPAPWPAPQPRHTALQRLQPLLLPHRQRLLLLTRLTIAPALHVFRGMASIVRTHMMP